jgi:hypothetical protein
MLKSTLKYAGICVAVVLFLTITVNNKTLFQYIYSAISPATRATQQATQDLVSFAFDKTHGYGKKLFDNSVPRVRAKAENMAAPAEFINEEEKEQLDDLIKAHR